MRTARILAACAAFATLVSCGGGGGGGGGGASLNTSQATITSGNATVFVNAIANIAAVAISTRVGPGTTFPETGIHGGTVTLPAAGLGGNVTGPGTYSALDRAAGAATTGTVTVTSGHYGTAMDNVHFSFTSLGYPPSSIVLSGSIDLVWVSVGSPDEYTMTFNVTATSGGNVIAVLDNFTVDSTIAAGQESLTFSGKYTDAAQGYVNVSTITPMVFTLPGGPASGVVVAQGTGTNKATMTFTGPTSANVVITP